MKVAHRPEELTAGECVAAIGSFDGVHRGHRRVLETARAAGGRVTVVTFWPHPRLVLGNRVELLSTAFDVDSLSFSPDPSNSKTIGVGSVVEGCS